MRRAARLLALGLAAGSLFASAALAQQPIKTEAAGAKAPTAPDPLRFGTPNAFLSFQPFFQFEAGHGSSSPDSLIGDVDNFDGQLRRARLYADFGYHDFGGRFTIDFAPTTGPDVIYAYLDYTLPDIATLQVGQQDMAFSMQRLIGSRSALFNENGQNQTLSRPGAVGVQVFSDAENYSLAGGVFGTDINVAPFDQSVTVAGRATYAPINTDEAALHLGVAVSDTFDSSVPISFSGDTGTPLFSKKTITSSAFTAVDSYLATNFEASATVGRFTLQSEYTLGDMDDGIRDDSLLHGGYLGVLAFLTDDHRGYDGKYGIFKRVKPAAPVGKGGFGAVEIGGRLDYLNLADAGPKAGTEIAGTGILNWYLTDQIRFSATDTYTAVTEGPDDGADYNTAMLRVWFVY
ncbi:hypothetical protein GCM10011390_31300 [Aureimonas endophytica]|uniref:Phosphate-selective porin OprO/OprP n=1 Tax=Aureimonas endophytica TaxID=2027858 RepID=A0A916ZS61_9HYPH|nr:porin [Aureimonas endophytica]GGE09983.1 hypothetical protein GCM10011390_31300 [Aureimonas endophytica]